MELDLQIKQIIESEAKDIKPSVLKNIAEDISSSYLSNSGENKHYINSKEYALTYGIMRLPATFSAISDAFSHLIEVFPFEIHSVLDLGAGMGTSALALSNYINASYVLVEREPVMIELGNKLVTYKNIKFNYVNSDIISYSPNQSFDLVIFGYSFNEFNEQEKKELIDKYLPICKVLLIVDPGTPKCYEELMKIRESAVDDNYHVVAPCPHDKKCPLVNDWCSFVTRVSRTSLHRYLKSADAPYEDEKYTYLALSSAKSDKDIERIIRHPKINANSVSLTLCNRCGICTKEIFKKEKELYKQAKKSKSGDILL